MADLDGTSGEMSEATLGEMNDLRNTIAAAVHANRGRMRGAEEEDYVIDEGFSWSTPGGLIEVARHTAVGLERARQIAGRFWFQFRTYAKLTARSRDSSGKADPTGPYDITFCIDVI